MTTLDVEFLAPAQQLDVLKAGAALVHELEHLIAEALDAWLDLADAGIAHLLQLRVAQVGLDLVEDLEL